MNPSDPNAPYELIRDAVGEDSTPIEAMTIGLAWSSCRTAEGLGLAMSPGSSTRLLEWPGSVAGRQVYEVAKWLSSWNFYEATVGLAAANAVINRRDNALMSGATPLRPEGPANLAVFEYFRPRLAGRKVVVIGRYPGLDRVLEGLDVHVLERDPGSGDLPDSAAEFLLPQADWVFITATSLINKTFPRLAALASDAITVLMGPSTPWLAGWAQFGIDFLAGVQPVDVAMTERIAAEGGGTQLFGEGVRYAIADIGEARMATVKSRIAETYARRNALKAEMEAWYQAGNGKRFHKLEQLTAIDAELSALDACFKRMWDARN